MGLDSLLALMKTDVSPVAGVQPNSGAAFGCNGTETADVSDVAAAAATRDGETSATARQRQTYQRKPAPMLACTSATSETPRIEEPRSESRKAAAPPCTNATSWRWLLHYTDREPMEVFVIPEATHAEALKLYPDAVAAEPIAERDCMVPFDPEAWEERAGIAEFDGGLSRADAERLAWVEDERRRCAGGAEANEGAP